MSRTGSSSSSPNSNSVLTGNVKGSRQRSQVTVTLYRNFHKKLCIKHFSTLERFKELLADVPLKVVATGL